MGYNQLRLWRLRQGSLMNDTIHVLVEHHDGQEEGDVGYPYYVASCIEIPAVTDTRTLDEPVTSIRDVIAFALEEEVL